MTKAQKIIAMAGSLIAAFLLWAYVVTFVNPVIDKTISNIPIQILHADSLPGQGYILTSVSHLNATVTVTGNRMDVSNVTADDIIATLDVAGYGEGENPIRLNVSTPAGVTIKDIKNGGRVTAYIEQYVTVPKPYEFLYSGSLQDNCEMGALRLNPESISVTGAKSEVDKVETLRVVLDLAKVSREGYAFESAVVPTSAGQTTVENVTLSAKKLTGTAYLCDVRELPLTVTFTGEIPEGFEAKSEPSVTVRVRSSSVDLDALGSIPTKPVDAASLTEEKTVVEWKPVLPEGVEYASGEDGVRTGQVWLEAVEEPEEETDGETND